MKKLDYKTFINGVGNDLKISIDDLIGTIIGLQEDVEELKAKVLKADKKNS